MELNLSGYFSGLNFLLGVCIFVLTTTIKRVWAPFWEKPLGQRLLTVVPLVLGVTLSFLGLHEEDITSWQETLAIGLVAAFGASYVFKIGKTTLLPWNDKKDKKPSEPPPKEENKP
jgi:hypothetical protein